MTPKTIKLALELFEQRKIQLDKPQAYWRFAEFRDIENGIKELKKLL